MTPQKFQKLAEQAKELMSTAATTQEKMSGCIEKIFLKVWQGNPSVCTKLEVLCNNSIVLGSVVWKVMKHLYSTTDAFVGTEQFEELLKYVCMYILQNTAKMSIRNTRVSAYTIAAARGSAFCITLL